MNATGPRFDPIARHLELYEESWRVEHEEVKRRVWPFEERLAVARALYNVINTRDRVWRDRVTSGKCAFDQEIEDEIKSWYRWWLKPGRDVMEKLATLEQEYGNTIEGAEEFRRFCREGEYILTNWTSPAPMLRNEEIAAMFEPARVTAALKELDEGKSQTLEDVLAGLD